MSALTCEECGRAFEKEAHRDVHPCPAELGEKTAREIRSMFYPGQFRLPEFADGTHPGQIDGQRGDD